MKSTDNRPVIHEGENQTSGVHTRHDETNQINIGSVGLEGGGDNGASTLRALRKKYVSPTASKRRPLL